jgi:hypothetical protein
MFMVRIVLRNLSLTLSCKEREVEGYFIDSCFRRNDVGESVPFLVF